MARIPYYDPHEASPTDRAHHESRGSLNLYRMLPYAGLSAPAYLSLGGAILRGGDLPQGLREIAIIRVGILCRCRYEVHHHQRLANLAGVSEAKIAAIADGPGAAPFDPLENLVLRFTDELVQNVRAPDPLFEALLDELGRHQLAELTLAVGFYLMVSRFLENFEVDVETTLP